MLKRYLFAGTIALASAGVAVGAQTPTTPQQNPNEPRTTQTEPQAQKQGKTTTLVGCVYRERDVPGRSPNVAERAGVLEDYILANVQMGDVSSQSERTTGQATGQTAEAGRPTGQPEQTTGQETATPGTAGTSGMAHGKAGKKHSMFKLEHADDDRLRALVGKRVEVTGRIDAEAGDTQRSPGTTGTTGTTTGTTGGTEQQPARDRSVGPDQIELPEFEVTSIREVSGNCPATPDAPQR